MKHARAGLVASVLVSVHRWLGIVFGALFVLWFLSGIVLMYRGMPQLPEGRLLSAQWPLEIGTAEVEPAEAARRASIVPERLTFGMVGERPAYRLFARDRVSVVFADTGELFRGFHPDEAVAVAARFAGPAAGRLRREAYLERPDQWTLQLQSRLPMHRIGEDDSTRRLYVSDRTGQVVLETTRLSRLWGWLGAVPHWLYFEPLRRRGSLWYRVVVGTSLAGIVLCASGLMWGLWVFSRRRRSPYRGWLFWHHTSGLAFGLATLGFVFSGLLSMEPFGWQSGTRATVEQREAVQGGPLDLSLFELDSVRRALAVLAREPGGSEVSAVQFQGSAWLMELRGGLGGQRIVSLQSPEAGSRAGMERSAVERAARLAMPGVEMKSADWIESYDAYYYHRHGSRPLPVLRARFSDPLATTLYLDALDGSIVHREQRWTRVNRWLYHGLHSWDLPVLYRRRPLWDLWVLLLLLGGLAATVSALVPGVRRLGRALRRAHPKKWGEKSG